MSSITKQILTPIETVSGDGKNRVRVEFLSFELPSNWFLALLAVPMFIGMAISGYLTYVSVTASEIVGCTGGELFDCSHVIYSKWSKLLNIPVSLLALGTYVTMIGATLVTAIKRFSTSVRQFAWIAVTGLAISAAFAAVYFIFLQVSVLKHLCPWCLGAHACGLLIATAIMGKYRIAVPQMAAVTGLAAAGLAVMIGVQTFSEEPQKYSVTEYVPAVAPKHNNSGGETYVVAPEDFDGEGGEMFAAPDDGVFEAPIDEDEEGLFSPPSEDLDDEDEYEEQTEGETAAINRATGFCSDVLIQLTAVYTPHLLVSVCQEPIQVQEQTRQEDESQQPKKDTEGAEDTEEPAKKQVVKKKPKKEKPKPRIVEFMGKKIDANQWPIDGSPTAKYVFVEMFDYTCPHCRTTSRAVFEAKDQMGDELAVVVLPVPMKMSCNSAVTRDHDIHREACLLSELAVAVWRCDKEKFSTFHKWMFEGDTCPDYATALNKAAELVGKERLDKELKKKTPGAFVQSHVQMYRALNGGAIPKLLFPTRSVQGEFTATDVLINMIKQTGQ